LFKLMKFCGFKVALSSFIDYLENVFKCIKASFKLKTT
jgi:hypothetical protein